MVQEDRSHSFEPPAQYRFVHKVRNILSNMKDVEELEYYYLPEDSVHINAIRIFKYLKKLEKSIQQRLLKEVGCNTIDTLIEKLKWAFTLYVDDNGKYQAHDFIIIRRFSYTSLDCTDDWSWIVEQRKEDYKNKKRK